MCYERADPLCELLHRPVLLYVALIGRMALFPVTGKLTATMRIAERIYSLAQEQNETAPIIGAYRALAGTLYYLGDFEKARQSAIRGVEILQREV